MTMLTTQEQHEIDRANTQGKQPVVFVHGLWLLASSWDPWRALFEEQGYTTMRFEEVVRDVDVVFDLVGGDTLQRSWQVVKPGGVLVSVVSPQPSFAAAKAHDVRPVWFVVEPNRDKLIQIGALIDAGQIRPIIDAVLPLSEARQAYEQGAKRHIRGKIVLRVLD